MLGVPVELGLHAYRRFAGFLKHAGGGSVWHEVIYRRGYKIASFLAQGSLLAVPGGKKPKDLRALAIGGGQVASPERGPQNGRSAIRSSRACQGCGQ
jgi:hypothetical protein